MTWKVKQKEGFFKTAERELSIRKDQLFLKPLEGKDQTEIRLSDQEILSITFTRQSQAYPELEIRTTGPTLILLVCEASQVQLEEMILQMSMRYGQKVSVA